MKKYLIGITLFLFALSMPCLHVIASASPSDEIFEAAQEGLSLYGHSLTELAPVKSCDNLEIGAGFQIYTVTPDALHFAKGSDLSEMSIPMDVWRFIVLQKAVPVTLMTVAKMDGDWKAVQFGSYNLAKKVVTIKDHLFFIIDDTTHGEELWVSHVKENKTHSIQIEPFKEGSSPDHLTPFNDKLYFSAEDKSNGLALWATDGEHLNTKIVKSFAATGASIQKPVSVNNHNLFFLGNDGTSIGLWQIHPKENHQYESLLVESMTGCHHLNTAGDRLFFLCE